MEDQEQIARMRNQMQDAFTNASFAPYGLDERWTGTRWIGGSGRSNGDVTRLELAHGENPFEEVSTLIRVEVRLPPAVFADVEQNLAIEWASTTRGQLSKFWLTTGTLDPTVRAAAYANEPRQGEPTAPWDDIELRLDGEVVTFQMLGNDDYWLAQAMRDQTIVAVEARAWPVESTGLITIKDLTPYAEGSEVIAARGRERFT